MEDKIRQRIRSLIDESGENPRNRLLFGSKHGGVTKRKTKRGGVTKRKTKRKESAWIKFVKRTAEKEGIDFREALTVASKKWTAEKRRLGI
ncbi:hypothetical protein LCGC14_2246810 [marine sediment metagenome]|uniref:Uncharacterized protein n=1 Tax=marine sediment metagenome TaxID=412755 RepID=A0A0F9D3I8_9ZZZZ